MILCDDGSHVKFALRSRVGIARNGEPSWLGDDPHVVVGVERAVAEKVSTNLLRPRIQRSGALKIRQYSSRALPPTRCGAGCSRRFVLTF